MLMQSQKLINHFFDINKLPPQEGILLFPISMSRISNAQSAKKCWEYMLIFSPKKIIKPAVGLNIIYADNLYMNSDEKSSKLKQKFSSLISSHKNEFVKILQKNPVYIQKAFSFVTWSQAVLECKEFIAYFGELKSIYKKDEFFKRCVKQDLISSGKKELDENQLNFFLEETLLFHLIAKGKVRLRNDFVNDHEKWILFCYPGKPLRSEIYLSQKNFFRLSNKKNVYENSYYDLSEKKLYDFSRVNLDKLEI